MRRTPIVVNRIRTVVESMRNNVELSAVMLSPLQIANGVTVADIPFFMPGHELEINNRLISKSTDRVNKWKKYPLIILRMDFPEKVNGATVDAIVNIGIVTETAKGYNAEERIQNVFEPVLYPLYDLFLLKLQESGLFILTEDADGVPPHTKIDRPYWGTKAKENSDENIFADPLDAIELVDLKLSFYNKELIPCL